MNILVTGGAGFIGSHLCDRLVLEKHNVIVIDNLSLGTIENLDDVSIEPNFTFFEGDAASYELDMVFNRYSIDMVYHLAANSDIKRGVDDASYDYVNTLGTTYNILRCMKKYGVNKLFFASTSAIFGDVKGLIHEDYAPLRPLSSYGAAKLASEAFISSFAHANDIQVWIARFPNVVGERATHGVIYDFINKLRVNENELEILGDGNQSKPYIYVSDLIDGIMFVVNNATGAYNVYHLGSNTHASVNDIANCVCGNMGLNPEYKFTGGSVGWVGDVPTFSYDLTKVNSLGWKPKYLSLEAVDIAVKNMLNHANNR